jgi:hypothetical protein
MKSTEDIRIDQVLQLANDLIPKIQAYPHNGLLNCVDGKLIADPYDMLDFLRQVEYLYDEVRANKELFKPKTPNPDQLSLF